MSSPCMPMNMSSLGVSPFTMSQWHELEHQALILKYLLAGMTVPQELIFHIKKRFESISSRLFKNTPLGYCSFYGKKVDPEPGRCRRTDGKKWRCSKDAYGDSKYCERHMHRGRNRSRKPVEQPTTQTTTTNPPLSTTLSSVSAVTGDNNIYNTYISGGGGTAGRYQNLPLNTFGSSQSIGTTTDQSQRHLENTPYGIPHKDYRYLYGLKANVGEHSFFSEASGKSLQVDSSLDSSWPLTSSQVSLFPTSKASDYSMLQNDYPQHSFLGNEFGTGSDHAKQGGNLIRPFSKELSKTKGACPSDLENEISKRSSFSSTQLSISIPMGSSDLSGTSSRSPPCFHSVREVLKYEFPHDYDQDCVLISLQLLNIIEGSNFCM